MNSASVLSETPRWLSSSVPTLETSERYCSSASDIANLRPRSGRHDGDGAVGAAASRAAAELRGTHGRHSSPVSGDTAKALAHRVRLAARRRAPTRYPECASSPSPWPSPRRRPLHRRRLHRHRRFRRCRRPMLLASSWPPPSRRCAPSSRARRRGRPLSRAPPGATFLIGGDPIVLDNVALHLTSSGRALCSTARTARAASRCATQRRCTSQRSASATTGRSTRLAAARWSAGRLGLTLDGGGVVDCEALWDAFVPDRVTIGGPYGKFAEAGGGGVAAIHGALRGRLHPLWAMPCRHLWRRRPRVRWRRRRAARVGDARVHCGDGRRRRFVPGRDAGACA